MRQYFRRQAHSDTLGTLSEQKRELRRQGHRLALAAVVAQRPLRHLRVEENVRGKHAQARLYVSGGSGGCAGKYIAPVTLRFNEQILLAELHKRVLYRRVTMRVVLHGGADNVGDLVEAAVVDGLHGMQYAALHRLEAVLDVGHRTLQYHIRRVLKKPALVHSAQMMAHEFVRRGIRRPFRRGFLDRFFFKFHILRNLFFRVYVVRILAHCIL